jgi:hypothetical protein
MGGEVPGEPPEEARMEELPENLQWIGEDKGVPEGSNRAVVLNGPDEIEDFVRGSGSPSFLSSLNSLRKSLWRWFFPREDDEL